MDLRGFCTSARLLIVAGKGGVGKTTVTAALARAASLGGIDTLIVEVEGRSGLTAAFGLPASLDYQDLALAPGIRARTLTPDDALIEYLDEHGMRRISRRLTRSGAVDLVATAVPGIKDILLLGKVKQLERGGAGATGAARGAGEAGDTQTGEPQLIILDAPAAGHAVTFLQSARGLLDAVRVGPIRSQAQEVVDLLTDPARCQVVLVTLPEETPVNELVETAYSLEDKVGVQLAPVVVNGMYPVLDGLEADPVVLASEAGVRLSDAEAHALAGAAKFRTQRQRLQAEQVARLANALPLPQIHLPFLFAETIGPDEIDLLSAAMTQGISAL